MERHDSERDFAYRHLSDTEDRAQATDLSAVSVVSHDAVELRVDATATLGTPHESLLLPERSGVLERSDVEPTDWASEEGMRQGAGRLTSRSTARELGPRRESVFTRQKVEMPVLISAASSAAGSTPNKSGRVLTPLSTSVSPAVQFSKSPGGSKETLHGKDLGQFVTIGSVDQIARHSNSVDWSEAVAAQSPEEPDHLTLMDPYYDLTKTKLLRVFHLFHPDAEGMVSYQGFRRGLEAMGIACADDHEFQSFVERVDEDHSGGISFDEFQQAIQEIKLAQLFREDFIREVSHELAHYKPQVALLGSIEYSPDRIRSVYPIGNVEKFIYSKKPSWATVRWVNVEGCDPLLIRRLSVRYRLHPLAVEDALDVERERPKYEKYDEHSSLILQTVRPVDVNKLRNYQRMYRNSLYDKDEGPSQFDLMDKKELEERLSELRIGDIMTNPEQLSVYMLKDVLISVQERTSPLWGVVKARLDTSYSKIRQNGTPFLAYTLVDACVDDLTPIVHTLGAKLVMLERLLSLDPAHFDITRLHNCSKQIKGLKRLCKPLNEVVLQMSESNDFTGEILRYFRDVQDHIAIVQEDCDKHLDTYKSLVDMFHNARAEQQNDVSFLLTLVAAIFLPAQFLTGLYGMNFEVMPELKYEYGYLIWWIVVLVLAVLTGVVLGVLTGRIRFKRWLH